MSRVAWNLRNLADIHFLLSDYECAEGEYYEATDLYRKLALDLPHIYNPEAATAVNSLAYCQ